MAEQKSGTVVKAEVLDKEEKGTVSIILKSNYPKYDKDGNKIGNYKPDERVSLPYAEAMELVNKAWAVKK